MDQIREPKQERSFPLNFDFDFLSCEEIPDLRWSRVPLTGRATTLQHRAGVSNSVFITMATIKGTLILWFLNQFSHQFPDPVHGGVSRQCFERHLERIFGPFVAFLGG